VSTLLVKLLLAPAFVVAASLAARRYGPRVGGLVGGLPVVAGPILLAFALDHGEHFAARAAVGTLLGLVSLTAFVVVYAWLCAVWPWWACLLTGWTAFLACTALLTLVPLLAGLALALACTAFVVALRVLPHPDEHGPPPTPPPWDLPARAGAALALVLALTAAARSLGSHVAGLLAPFPIIASILAAFTHAHSGVEACRRLLRGMQLGFFAFAFFCFVVAVTIEPLGIAASFLLATAVALATQAAALVARPR
jgi:fucose 4-O-acetylase-like acetyltransferase